MTGGSCDNGFASDVQPIVMAKIPMHNTANIFFIVGDFSS